jgi:hypothetical protein
VTIRAPAGTARRTPTATPIPIPTDADTDSDSDSDANTDTDDCTPPAWGGGFTVGEPVADWTQLGYLDADDDGIVEQDEVIFSLTDIACAGFESIVMLIGDTS